MSRLFWGDSGPCLPAVHEREILPIFRCRVVGGHALAGKGKVDIQGSRNH